MGCVGLLHYMSQLMRSKFQIAGTASSAIINIRAVGEGVGAHLSIHLNGFTTGMNAHVAEIYSKTWLHIGAHGIRQLAAVAFALVEAGFDLIASLETIR